LDFDYRDGKLHPNLFTVPAQGFDFNQLSKQWAFASLQITSEPLSMPFAISRWDNQLSQLLADCFITRKAKDALCSWIEFSHAPRGVHGDDAIERRIKKDTIKGLQRCGRISHSLLQLLFSRHRNRIDERAFGRLITIM